MLNLDCFIEDRLEISIFGEKITIKEPTAGMYDEVNRIEKDMDMTNMGSKRIKVAVLFINNNEEGRLFFEEQFETLPFAVPDTICKEVIEMRKRVEKDPNFRSRSPKDK